MIEAFLVINLDHRVDRWTEFLATSQGRISRDQIHRISAILGSRLRGAGQRPWFKENTDSQVVGSAGCTLSHRKALQFAEEQNFGHVVILEDDVKLLDSFSSMHDFFKRHLKRHASLPDLTYLGCKKPAPPFKHLSVPCDAFGLYEISGAFCTHAYLISPRLRRHLLQVLPTEDSIWPWIAQYRCIDRWMSYVLRRKFSITAIMPAIAVQSESFSDITQKICTRDSNALGPFVSGECSFYQVKKFLAYSKSLVKQIGDILSVVPKYFMGI